MILLSRGDKMVGMNYKNKNILITGGLGFIGSNLAIRLVAEGANVTLVDNMLPGHGGNLFNIDDIKDKVTVNFSDIRDPLIMDYLVRDKDYIFHLAGQVNHIESIKNPILDLDINCKGTLVILESCRKCNPKAKIIFTGTRGQYGHSIKLPVDEEHPMNPKGIYAITNLAAEKMILAYHNVHNIKGICLRISNTYGPRHQMHHDQFGVLNWFIRRAIDDETIFIFGDGLILRDFLYIDDLVDCLFKVGLEEKAYGEIFNIGSGKPINFLELAEKAIKIVRKGKIEFTNFSQEREALEPGDYYTDISKVIKFTGWHPLFELDEGIKRTTDFYCKYKEYYW